MRLLFGFLFILLNYNIIAIRLKRQISFPEDETHSSASGEDCLTYRRTRGNCILLDDCPRLRSTRNIRILRANICGYDDNKPKVCCQLSRQQKPTSRPSRLTTSKTTKIPETIHSLLGDEPDRPRKLPEYCGNRTFIGITRVVGGETSIPGAWPWMAAILFKESGNFSAQCGGALISYEEVITASHCVVENGRVIDPSTIMVRLGEHNIERKTREDAEQDFRVVKITAHQRFEPKIFKNDIAILKLARKVSFNTRIWPICLPYDSPALESRSRSQKSNDEPVYITGWGRDAYNGKPTATLQQAELRIIPQEDCNKAFEKFVKISDEYICAGVKDSIRDSCQGDSGGPLVQFNSDTNRYYLIGVVSFGRKCATNGYPGVYARVEKYLGWINTHIK